MKFRKFELDVSVKGLAIIAAIESNLLPTVECGWDDSAFEIFWKKFQDALKQNGFDIVPLKKKRKDKRKDR